MQPLQSAATLITCGNHLTRNMPPENRLHLELHTRTEVGHNACHDMHSPHSDAYSLLITVQQFWRPICCRMCPAQPDQHAQGQRALPTILKAVDQQLRTTAEDDGTEHDTAMRQGCASSTRKSWCESVSKGAYTSTTTNMSQGFCVKATGELQMQMLGQHCSLCLRAPPVTSIPYIPGHHRSLCQARTSKSPAPTSKAICTPAAPAAIVLSENAFEGLQTQTGRQHGCCLPPLGTLIPTLLEPSWNLHP